MSCDAVYCAPCVLFGSQRDDAKERTFTQLSPVTDCHGPILKVNTYPGTYRKALVTTITSEPAKGFWECKKPGKLTSWDNFQAIIRK